MAAHPETVRRRLPPETGQHAAFSRKSMQRSREAIGAVRGACRVPLEAVQGVAVEAVMPVFRAAVDAAEQHVLRMHAQDFGAADAPSVAGASPYMADLIRHISHCRPVPPCLPPTPTGGFGHATTEEGAPSA